MHMPSGNRNAIAGSEEYQDRVDAPAPALGIVYSGYEEDDPERNDRNSLQYAQRARVEEEHMLCKQCEAHHSCTSSKARKIEDASSG